MKKTKLFLSIVSLCFSLAVLCFGVYAANQVNYSISGNITYQVEDAFVEVRTKIYSLEEISDGPTLTNTCFELGQKDFFTSSNFSSFDLVDIDIPLYESINDMSGLGGGYDELELTFNEDAKTFYVVMNVKNLSSDINVWAVMDYSSQKYEVPEGVLQRDNAIQQWIGTQEGESDNQSIVIGLSLADPTTSFSDEDIKLSIKIGTGDYSQTAENLAKMEFGESRYDSDNSEYMVTNITEYAEGVLVVPEYYYDEEDEENHEINFIADDEEFDSDSSEYAIRSIIVNASLGKIGEATFFNFEMNSLVFNNSIDNVQEGALDSGNYSLECVFAKYISGARYTTHTSDGSINLNAIIDTTNKVLLVGSAGTDIENLPNDLSRVGLRAFNNNNSLTKFIIPSSVEEIGEYAFACCINVTSALIIPSDLAIGNNAFCGCSNVSGIVVQGNHQYLTSKNNLGNECNCLIEKSTNKMLLGCAVSEIPTTITTIDSNAFLYCQNLDNVVIPHGVGQINGNAFYGSSLKSIVIPVSVSYVLDGAFCFCDNLTNIYIYSTTGWDSNWKKGCSATVYTYSASEPAGVGNYWHYVNDVVTEW